MGGKTIYGGTSFFFFFLFWSRSQWFVVGLKVRSFVVFFFFYYYSFSPSEAVLSQNWQGVRVRSERLQIRVT